jgi:hypothetical protein
MPATATDGFKSLYMKKKSILVTPIYFFVLMHYLLMTKFICVNTDLSLVTDSIETYKGYQQCANSGMLGESRYSPSLSSPTALEEGEWLPTEPQTDLRYLEVSSLLEMKPHKHTADECCYLTSSAIEGPWFEVSARSYSDRFRDIPQSLRTNAGIYLKSGHNTFISYPYQPSGHPEVTSSTV